MIRTDTGEVLGFLWLMNDAYYYKLGVFFTLQYPDIYAILLTKLTLCITIQLSFLPKN